MLLFDVKSALLTGLSFVAASAAPPPERSVAQWAEQERIVSKIESRYDGPWSNDRFPAAVEVMQACSRSSPSTIIAIRGSAQSIKSEIAKNTIGAYITDDPRNILVILPSNDEVTKYERTKLDPMLRETDCLARRVYGVSRPGAKKTTIKLKEFRNGFIQLTAAGSSKGLQMITVGLIVAEEVTEFPPDTGGRGFALDQAMERAEQFRDILKVVVPSTPGRAGRDEAGAPLCKITALFEAGDQRWLFWKCVHCGDWYRLRFSHLAEESGRAVAYAPCCGTLTEHKDKRKMLGTSQHDPDRATFIPCFESKNEANQVPWARGKDGAVIDDVIRASDLAAAKSRDCEGRDESFHIWRGQSPFSNWSTILKAHQAALTDPLRMKVFCQQYLAEPYEEAVNAPAHEKLFAMRGGAPDVKARPIRRGFIPPWAGFVTMACDLQGDYGVWRATAYGPGHLAAAIDHGVIDINPNDPRFWTQLRAVFNQPWQSTHLRPQRAVKMGLDTGGLATQDAYRFVISNPDIIALKGMTGPKARFEPLIQPSRRGGKLKGLGKRAVMRVPLWLLNTHEIKKIVFFGLHNAINSYESGALQPGLNLFYHDEISSAFTRELTAEVLKVDHAKNQEAWQRLPGRQNEQLDLEVYTYALSLMHGLARMTESDWTALFAREALDPALADLTPLERLAREWPRDLPFDAAVDLPPAPPAQNAARTSSWMDQLLKYPGNNYGLKS